MSVHIREQEAQSRAACGGGARCDKIVGIGSRSNSPSSERNRRAQRRYSSSNKFQVFPCIVGVRARESSRFLKRPSDGSPIERSRVRKTPGTVCIGAV